MPADPKPTSVACPDCHLLGFWVTRDPRSGTLAIVCQECNRVLLSVETKEA